jgi:hypothetical protein
VQDEAARTFAAIFNPSAGHSVERKPTKWRGQDLNLRPSGYEPDSRPDGRCSTVPDYAVEQGKYGTGDLRDDDR